MGFLKNVKSVLNNENHNVSITENGAVGYKTTGKELLDMSFKVSSMRNWTDDQIKDQGVEGEHHADQYDDAHDRSNNTCFHRLDLLFTGRVPRPSGLSLAPAKPPGRPVPAPRAGGLGFTVRQTGGNDG